MRLDFIAAAGLCVLCVFDGDASAQLRTRVHASGFSQPVAFVQSPTDRNVQFVVQQGGRIRVVQNGNVLATDFLNLTSEIAAGGEQGLLCLAFAPDYATSGRFFVTFTNPAGNFVVSRFTRSANPLVANPSSRKDLMLGPQGFVPHPFANHNGGQLAFGPDGYLYVGLGDGGSGNDPDHRAQNPADLLGKLLRLNVAVPDSNSAGYSIPADNPFVDNLPVTARQEIWAFGLRNPWRFSFDDVAHGGTGALIIGDVGQNAFEEVDFEPRGSGGGRNYGWRNREGRHDNVTSRPPAFTPLVDPIFEYGRADGQSITGGFVYRGSSLPANYRGRYFYADYVAGRIWSFDLAQANNGAANDVREHTAELGKSAIGNISSFGVDADGEIYIVNHTGGSILKIIGPPPTPSGVKIIP